MTSPNPTPRAGQAYCVAGKVNSADKLYLVIESVGPTRSTPGSPHLPFPLTAQAESPGSPPRPADKPGIRTPRTIRCFRPCVPSPQKSRRLLLFYTGADTIGLPVQSAACVAAYQIGSDARVHPTRFIRTAGSMLELSIADTFQCLSACQWISGNPSFAATGLIAFFMNRPASIRRCACQETTSLPDPRQDYASVCIPQLSQLASLRITTCSLALVLGLFDFPSNKLLVTVTLPVSQSMLFHRRARNSPMRFPIDSQSRRRRRVAEPAS